MPLPNAELATQDVATLRTVDLNKLLDEDSEETASLLSACKDEGFFFLMLSSPESRDVWQQAEQIFGVMEELFSQPVEEKMRFDVRNFGISESCGYKPLGTQAGIVEGGRDAFESYKIPLANILSLNPAFPSWHPHMLCPHWALLRKFMMTSHSIAVAILQSLSNELGLKEEDRFESSHKNDAQSNSALAFNKYPKRSSENRDLGHNAHTDIGSITLLFCREWGLQVLLPETDEWKYVAPIPYHIVVNVGDSLKFLSQQKLQSCLHRVVPFVGKEGPRYSLAYFLRPCKGTVFTDSEGTPWRAQEWHDRKFELSRESHEVQRMTYMLTGRKDFHTSWK